MKFYHALLTLPLLINAAVSPSQAVGQTTTTENDITSRYRVAAPFQLQPVVGSDSSTSAPCKLPQLSLPVLPEATRPWTQTQVHNNPQHFQIAIVTDRNGGNRPGIFTAAMHKLNVLQPEFVMSIGDFIAGYTKDPKALNAMWEEFEGVLAKLQMPFFMVPGNHDMSNAMERTEWHRRFGPSYYHFTYGDVLFLCLNTDDEAVEVLSEPQVSYVEQVLQEHKNVRWTLIFMHKPLWAQADRQLNEDNPRDLEALKKSRWYNVEQALKSRNYTVFAGHVHAYTRYERHGQKYYTLATTGGGSSMRGAETYGRYDHVTWLTMTDNGPLLMNLDINGMYPEDVRTEEEATLMRHAMRTIQLHPLVTGPLPFSSATLHLNLHNTADRPVALQLALQNGGIKSDPPRVSLTLAAGERKPFSFAIDGSGVRDEKELQGLTLNWSATYKVDGRKDTVVTNVDPVEIDVNRKVEPLSSAVTIDGDTGEWASTAWSIPQKFQQVVGKTRAWGGYKDVSFRLATQHDADTLYVGVRVQDDHVMDTPKKSGKKNHVDSLRLVLLPQNAPEKLENAIVIDAHPAKKGAGKIQSRLPKGKSSHKISAAVHTTPDGYDLEAAVPAALLNATGGEWNQFRMNIIIDDHDNVKGNRASKTWWVPQWETPRSYLDSGKFLRGQ